jgi:hypothetical protein
MGLGEALAIYGMELKEDLGFGSPSIGDYFPGSFFQFCIQGMHNEGIFKGLELGLSPLQLLSGSQRVTIDLNIHIMFN